MYQFAIIGSGHSGGILAANLHAQGASVVLLEAGKFLDKDTFPRTEVAYLSKLFWGAGLEFDTKANTAFLRGRVIGGTSIVNHSLLNRFDDEVFRDWKERSGVDFFDSDKMKPYYDKVEEKSSIHTFTESDLTRNAEIFISGSEKCGYKWEFSRRGQSDCALDKGNDCLGCLGGCHRDSKQSSLVTNIQKAHANGMEIQSEYCVQSIEQKKDFVVIYGDHQKSKKSIKAEKVILAGGSFGSTQILLNSGFGDSLPALGKGFTQHPQFMFFGKYKDVVNSHKGAFQTVASADPKFRKNGFKLKNVFAPPISIGMLFNDFGEDHMNLMRNYTHYSCIELAVRDEASGQIKVDRNGILKIEKDLTQQDKNRRDAGIEAVESIFKSTGAEKIIHSPFYLGMHLMGGCSIGSNGEKSVVNPDFQVFGTKNIYIADSSVFPAAPGINPALTIMALSQRLSETIINP